MRFDVDAIGVMLGWFGSHPAADERRHVALGLALVRTVALVIVGVLVA